MRYSPSQRQQTSTHARGVPIVCRLSVVTLSHKSHAYRSIPWPMCCTTLTHTGVVNMCKALSLAAKPTSCCQHATRKQWRTPTVRWTSVTGRHANIVHVSGISSRATWHACTWRRHWQAPNGARCRRIFFLSKWLSADLSAVPPKSSGKRSLNNTIVAFAGHIKRIRI